MKAAGQMINLQPIPMYSTLPMAMSICTPMYSCLNGFAPQTSVNTAFQMCDSAKNDRFCVPGRPQFTSMCCKRLPYTRSRYSAHASRVADGGQYFLGGMLGINCMSAFKFWEIDEAPAPSNKDSTFAFPLYEILGISLALFLLVIIGRVVMNTAWESRIRSDSTDPSTAESIPEEQASKKTTQL